MGLHMVMPHTNTYTLITKTADHLLPTSKRVPICMRFYLGMQALQWIWQKTVLLKARLIH